MRALRTRILLVPVTLVCCVAALGVGGQTSDIDKILSLFPGYHLLALSERTAETKAFIHQHLPKDNPSVVHADFDGDGHPDYAVLLRSNKSGATKLVVLLCSADQNCKSVFDREVTTSSSSPGELYLRPVPPGSVVSQTDAIDTKSYPAPERLNSTGIEVNYFGKATVVYYWNRKHKKIEAVQTED